MFTQSGRLVKKKKTTVKVGTKDPVFNETLNFEVSNTSFNFQAFLSFISGSSRSVRSIQVLSDIVQQKTDDHGGCNGGNQSGQL